MLGFYFFLVRTGLCSCFSIRCSKINIFLLSLQNNKSSPSPLQDVAPAVLATESVHVNLNNSSNTSASPPKITNTTTTSGPTRVNASTQKNAAVSPITTPPPAASDMSQMRTIELSTGRVREGFGKLMQQTPNVCPLTFLNGFQRTEMLSLLCYQSIQNGLGLPLLCFVLNLFQKSSWHKGLR